MNYEHWIWSEAAEYCEQTYGVEVDMEERYFRCPECDEPIYECDWENENLHFCPVCEVNFEDMD